MEIVGIITARGGSKGLPRKNIRLLDGKPLIVHTINSALVSSRIARCLVSTEDPEIKEISLKAGAEVLDRPHCLASDIALSRDVILDVLRKLDNDNQLPDMFMLLQPTSPLRTAIHIDECIESFLGSKTESAMSVTVAEHHPFKMLKVENDLVQPITKWEDLETPRQKLPIVYRPNGAMYLMGCKTFLTYKRFFIPPVMPFIMQIEDSVDIDCLSDLTLCESILKQRRLQSFEK